MFLFVIMRQHTSRRALMCAMMHVDVYTGIEMHFDVFLLISIHNASRKEYTGVRPANLRYPNYERSPYRFIFQLNKDLKLLMKVHFKTMCLMTLFAENYFRGMTFYHLVPQTLKTIIS